MQTRNKEWVEDNIEDDPTADITATTQHRQHVVVSDEQQRTMPIMLSTLTKRKFLRRAKVRF